MTNGRRKSSAEIRAELLRDAQAVLRDPVSAIGEPRIARIERAIAPVDLISRLASQPAESKWYWAARDNAWAVAAAGAACSASGHGPNALHTATRAVANLLERSGERVRIYGGARFDESCPESDVWSPFAAAQFFAPRLELRREGERFTLSCQLLLPDDARDLAREDELSMILSADTEPDSSNSFDAEVITRTDTPTHARWNGNVVTCLDAFQRGEAEKIVLARQSDFMLDEAVRPFALLRAIGLGTPNSFHYCFQPREGVAFIGASPERLYRRDGRRIETEALAGTRPRGATPEEDARLGEELIASDKEQREHAHVSRTISDVLRDRCTDFEEGTPHLLRLGHYQHLLTPLLAELRDSTDDATILRDLHPTPAVGGVPRGPAIDRIRELEDFDRGWYTGPIGWMDRTGAEFAVAIRSALVHGACVSVYTGAGIVPGSDPDDEWRELESKLADFRAVLEDAPADAGVIRQ